MSSALYNAGKQALLRGQANLQDSNVAAALVSNTYVLDLAAHTNLTHISTHVIGGPQSLAGRTTTDGVFDAADTTFPVVPPGVTAQAVVLYMNTGTPATSTLLAYIGTITGFPLAGNGGDVNVQWDNGAFRIFSL